jgi:GT2 family glycosyltransferase
MKLSIIIVCWNDLRVIAECLRSVYSETTTIDFEVIVSDNGSTDGSPAYIRQHFPAAQIIENGVNLAYAQGNNVGIRVARGEFVLLLNPDTIIHDHALEKLVSYAEKHPEAAAFGCRVLNPDGSFQNPARPLPTLRGEFIAALYLRWLGRLSSWFESDLYLNWGGRTERQIGVQSGCCILVRGEVLKELGGFDERFFYNKDETDLCQRIWKSGRCILFYPKAEITHLGGQSVVRFRIRYALEAERSLYRYFYKHYGKAGLVRIRRIALLHLYVRSIGYGLLNLVKPSDLNSNRLEMYKVLIEWHRRVNPFRFIQTGEEPDVGYPSPAMPPKTPDIVPSANER